MIKKKSFLNLTIIAVFLILPYLFFKDAFFLNKYLHGTGDAFTYNFPIRLLIDNLFKKSQLPLWNNYNFCGFPLISDIQAGTFYIPNIIFGFIFNSLVAYNFNLFIHYSLGGIFTYFFTQELKLNKLASFVSGLIFMFSGFFILRKSHPQMIFVSVWLPLVLFLFERYVKTRNKKFIIAAGIVIAVQYFGGSPQLFLYCSILSFFYVIFIFIKNSSHKKIKENIYILYFLSAFVIAFLLFMFQFLPLFELMKKSYRANMNFENFSLFSFNILQLPLLLFPYVYGKYNPGQFKDLSLFASNYPEIGMYLGIFPFFVSILGFFNKSKYRIIFGILCCFSLLMVFGKYLPFFKLTYHIPFLNYFRVPVRYWIFFIFSYSILAGLGIDYLIKSDYEKIKKSFAVLLGSIFLVLSGFFGFYVYFKKVIRSRNQNSLSLGTLVDLDINNIDYNLALNKSSVIIPLIIFFILIVFLIIFLFLKKKNSGKQKMALLLLPILIFFDLFAFGHNFEPVQVIDMKKNIEDTGNTPVVQFLKNDPGIYRIYPVFNQNQIPSEQLRSLNSNLNAIFFIESISGYNPLFLREYNEITSINETGLSNIPWNYLMSESSILDTSNVKYVVFLEDYIKGPKAETEFIYGKNYSEKELVSKNDIDKYILDSGLAKKQNQGRSFLFAANTQDLKVLNIPAKIESGCFYKINFKIKKAESFIPADISKDYTIHFDFYGVKNDDVKYDDFNQEYIFDTLYMTNQFKEHSVFIYSYDVPENIDTYFRMFYWQSGDFEIKDLSISKIDKEIDLRITADNMVILKNDSYLPRFYFTKNILNVKDIDEAKNKLWNKSFDPHETTLVEDYDLEISKFVDSIDNEINIKTYKNNHIDLEVNARNEGFLVFLDSYYSGWQAYVDGMKTKVYKVNGLFKGIYVPEGEHEVRFMFLPKSLIIGSSISFATFIIAVILLCLPQKIFDVVFKTKSVVR